MAKEKTFLVALLTAAYTISLIDRGILSLAAPKVQAAFAISDIQLGLLQGLAFSLLYAVAGIPLGWAIDRWSRRWILVFAIGTWSIMTLLCGLAASFGQMFAARIGVGIGEAALSPAAYALLSAAFPGRKLAVPMAIYGLGAVFGPTIAALISARVFSLPVSEGRILLGFGLSVEPWRLLFMLAALPGIVAALFFAFSPVFPPAPTRTAARQEEGNFATFLLSAWRLHVVLCLSCAAITLINYAWATWLPTLLARSYHWSMVKTGYVLSLASFTGGLLGCGLAAILPRFFKRNAAAASFRTTCAAVILLGSACVLAPLAPTAEGVVAVFTLAMMAFPAFAIASATTMQLLTPAIFRGRVSSMFLLCNIGLGASIGPAAIGWVSTSLLQEPDALPHALSLVSAGAVSLAVGGFAYTRRRVSEPTNSTSYDP